MCYLLKRIHPSFLSLFFINIIKDILKIFTRCAKENLVFAALKLVIVDFRNLLIDKDESINNIKHVSNWVEFLSRENESQRVEMVYTAEFLEDKAALD